MQDESTRRVSGYRFLLLASYVVLGATLLLIPPARTLHAESAAVCAVVGFLFAGLSVLHTDRGLSVRAAIRTALLWPLVPFVALGVATVANPSCLTLAGPLLYAAFVPFSSLFGAALAFVIRHRAKRLKTFAFVVCGILTVLASTAFDLLGHPQFYSYSHVFGGVLGPVYDRALAIRPGVFSFRLVTLLWVALLFLVAQKGRIPAFPASPAFAPGRRRVAVAALLVALCACYLGRGKLGFNTTYSSLRASLRGHVATANFDLYFDPATPEAGSVAHLAATAEFEFQRLADRMGVLPSQRIAVYLYPDADSRARLTGARNTSIAPVWLATPQIHMLAARVEDSFSHELVHVFSREFGAPVINASPLVGLVEGLAGALEAPSLGLDADAVVRVAAHEFGWTPSDITDRLRSAMSPTGFWSGRSAVNYALAASFGRYLLDEYPPEVIADVYATGRFQSATSRSLAALSAAWATALTADSSAVPEVARQQVRSAFSAESLFELRCPHAIPRSFSALVAGDRAWRGGDTLSAVAHWDGAGRDARLAVPVSERLALAAMFDNNVGPAIALGERPDSSLTTSGLIVHGDALAINGSVDDAGEHYRSALQRITGASLDDESMVAIRLALANDRDAIAAFYDSANPADVAANAFGTPRAWGLSRRAARRHNYGLADSLLRSVSVPQIDSLNTLLLWHQRAQLARYAERVGRWEQAVLDWEEAAGVTGIDRFAMRYALYRADVARWIDQQ